MTDTNAPASLGSTWEIKSKDNVTVTRPDGTTALVASFDGIARYVLDVPGEYVADVTGKPITVKAG